MQTSDGATDAENVTSADFSAKEDLIAHAERLLGRADEFSDVLSGWSLADQLRAVGQAVWVLVGRSVARFVAVFLLVFGVSIGGTGWVALITVDPTGLLLSAFILSPLLLLLIPLSLYAAFSFVAYRGIADLVEQLGIGRRIGAVFAERLAAMKLDRLSLPQFKQEVAAFTRSIRNEQKQALPSKWSLSGVVGRFVGAVILFIVGRMMNKIAKGALVDGVVDLSQLATGLGGVIDGQLHDYFKRILWDLMRLIVALMMLGLFVVTYVLGSLIGWLT